MIVIPREICRDAQQAVNHEWFESNGRGSYASASITGALTRRHHGLLVALLEPASSE
ncbi:glycogen debranching enzyme N-terminal domain-containing protein, partial [Salmonella sp. SAL4444]|uniref:glycogen debranching enzyme N-terminal domain-containing protein n=1 Tax=Salmonella sp. SAL4444 TaxID=3159899 RepID=UPI00397D66FC